MKNILISISTFLIILYISPNINGQNNRTLETQIADILIQLPTQDLKHSNLLMEELMSIGSDGILQLSNMLVPAGIGDDTQVRFALHSLAVYKGGKKNSKADNIVENTLIKAIKIANANEIKTFLIRRLAFCGSNASVHFLSSFLLDADLNESALASMVSIGTPEAAQSIFEALKKVHIKEEQPAFIYALGDLYYKPAIGLLQNFTLSTTVEIKRQSLIALAKIADKRSEVSLFNAAQKARYSQEPTESVIALIKYANRLHEVGDIELSTKIGNALLENCTVEDQLHYRAAAISLLRENQEAFSIKTLLKEFKHPNKKYRQAVLNAASQHISGLEVLKWVKAYKKASIEGKQQILLMLKTRNESKVFDKCIVSALKAKNKELRITGIKVLAFQDKSKAFPQLLAALKNATNSMEYDAIEGSLLRICSSDNTEKLATMLSEVNDNGKIVLLNVLSARNAKEQFKAVVSLLDTSNKRVSSAVYRVLPSMVTSKDLSILFSILEKAKHKNDISNIQQSISNALDTSDSNSFKLVLNTYTKAKNKEKIIPLLAALNTKESLKLVKVYLKEGDEKGKMIAVKSLSNWKNNDALPILFHVIKECKFNEVRSVAFDHYLTQVSTSTYPDDQKLLLIKELMNYSKNIDEKATVINRVGRIKTFLALIFVSSFLDIKELANTAAYAATSIALPTAGIKNGLSGDIVKEIMIKSKNVLSGSGSEYTKIDIDEFLSNLSDEKGFVSIFNGKNLTGWEGLVKNPIERRKMSKRQLASAQRKADIQMKNDWFVNEGIIGFKGEGYNNICTIKDYGDFEMIVDWKITNGGDSGIYLRGTPQVQIWDTARVDAGAQVGSGGLYNNKMNKSIPLVVADNPIDQWNTFRIKMVGQRVTVYLNGILVTDNVILENYWDRILPIFKEEAIELQAHGENLGFRNIYVREIISGDNQLTTEEKKEGFKSLFNGKNLDLWVGNKKDYFVENNELLVRPKQGGHGNLYTSEEYSDFIFRFEFKLTPGANNGLGIHAPLEGDAAYMGKEIQILDNTASIYAKLKPYQYHGSVYGIIPAKKGFLKPVGAWNSEEVMVKGDHIKVMLNGTVIIDGNMKEATKNGTLDGKNHSGLKRNKGHIGFLGHGSELKFRNIRIKDLTINN